MSETPCPFCPPPAERIVASNELAVAIRDGYPVSPGHTLVIPKRHLVVAAHRALGTKGFVKASCDMTVMPYVVQNIARNEGRAIDARITRLAGYAISQRKCIEQCFHVGKTSGPIRQVMVRWLDKVDRLLTLTIATSHPRRLSSRAQLQPESVR